MNSGKILLNQNIKTMQNYVIWIMTALLFRLKQEIFTKILGMMLKNGLLQLTIVTTFKKYKQKSSKVFSRMS